MNKPLTDIVLGRPVKPRSSELPADKIAELNAALRELQAQRGQSSFCYIKRPEGTYERPKTFRQLTEDGGNKFYQPDLQ